MYLAYYNLSAKPFQISTDPAFLWLGPKHREALSTLRYGVLDNRGFLLLTGDVGTGKTTLIHALLKSLSQNVVAATVPDPGLAPLDFFNYISRGFQFGTRFSSKGDFLDHFIDFLETSHKAGKKVLLIIDESQRLTPELLEEIRLLSNIEKFETKLLNIFFVGQNEFNDFLMLPGHKALRQRITINYHIAPLTKAETGAYIRHRLKVAGARMDIFDDDGIGEVFHFSSGYPRLINIICDHAMLTGFIKSAELVNGEIVRRCAADLTLPGQDGLQAEVAQARKPSPPPAQAQPEEPTAPGRPKGRWRAVVLVLLLASLLLGGYLRYRYPSGFEPLQALWQTHFGGTNAQTTDLSPKSPPPEAKPAAMEPTEAPAFPMKPATPTSSNRATPPAPTTAPAVEVVAPQGSPMQPEPPQPSPAVSAPPEAPAETSVAAPPTASAPRIPSTPAGEEPLPPAAADKGKIRSEKAPGTPLDTRPPTARREAEKSATAKGAATNGQSDKDAERKGAIPPKAPPHPSAAENPIDPADKHPENVLPAADALDTPPPEPPEAPAARTSPQHPAPPGRVPKTSPSVATETAPALPLPPPEPGDVIDWILKRKKGTE